VKYRFTRLITLAALLSMFGSLVSVSQPTRAAEPNNQPAKSTTVDTAAATTVTSIANAATAKPKKAQLYGALPKGGTVKVIVQLRDEPLATYAGTKPGLKATAPAATGSVQLNAQSAESVAYINYLETAQAAFFSSLKAANINATKLASYKAAYNGMALDLPVGDVQKLLALPEVAQVEVAQVYKLDTDSSNAFINTPALWSKTGGTAAGTTGGEGIVIGVIDSGVYNPSTVLTTTGIHPSLTDPSPIGGDYPSTFTYKGVCAPSSPQVQDGKFGPCNDKLIGAWWYNAGGIADPGESKSPLDEGGHGTHTLTTSGGNGGVVSPFGTVSGVAPRARMIMYKVCWEESAADPNDGGCNGADSVSAIDQSILDGVKVLNYSISGGDSPWTDAVEVAFRNATAAGIIVNASAGNAGTVGSVAHESPWLITVAASTQAREFKGNLTNVSGPTPPTPLVGASLYPGSVTGVIKLAPLQAVAGEVATVPGLCQAPYAAGTFAATDIVICRRGINARVLKYANVFAGGAGGGIIVNATNNQGVVADFCTKVCLHLEKNSTIESAAGEDLITFVAAHPGTTGTLNGGVKVMGPGDKMAGFSSLGPAGTPNLLKPDVTLIGVDVNAGHTAFVWDTDFVDGQKFQVIGGTSMSSPHSAGISALMRQLHPTWSPAEIKSAMMSTAKTSVVKPDGTTPADPFDFGSGRVNPTNLVTAGLTLDETVANFVAANPADDGDPRTLNLANAVNNACVQICTWTRTVKNRSGVSTTWNSAGSVTNGITVTVSPASFTLANNAVQIVTITANATGVPIDGAWRFGQVTLTESTNKAPASHFPVAVIAARGQVPVEAELTTHRTAGSETIDGFQAVAITALTIRDYGLAKGVQTTRVITGDSANGSAYDNLTDGVFYTTFTVPAGAKRLVAQVLESPSLDLDMFIARDANNDGIPQAGEQVYSSATGAVLEQVDVLNPTAGTYFAIVQNWTPSAGAPDLVKLITAVVPGTDVGNLNVTGPASVPAGQLFSVNAAWNEPTMKTGDIWYGLFDLGTDAANPGNIGATKISIEKLPEDVSKVASSNNVAVGQYVTYTLTITNYSDLADTFYLTDTLPAGLTIDQASLTGGAVYNAGTNTVTWNGSIAAPASGYGFTDSRTGGPSLPFVDLTGTPNVYNLCAGSAQCDESAVTYTFTAVGTYNMFGQAIDKLRFFSNGLAQDGTLTFDGAAQYYYAQDMPDATSPNGVFGGLWSDLDLDGTSASDTGSGTMLLNALTGVDPNATGDAFIVAHYKNADLYAAPSSDLNFNIMYRLGTSGQVCAVYGSTLTGDLVAGADEGDTTFSGVSVGIENGTGTAGNNYYFSGTPLAHKPAPSTTICAAPQVGAPQTHTVTFRAMVTSNATITNTVDMTSAQVVGHAMAQAVINVKFSVYIPAIRK
jgi:uncharacterized repeat protein (TIGR01451 family)